jgi:hypothetical protein
VIPRLSLIHRDNTHRLIPSAHGENSPLSRLTANEEILEDFIELEGGTNDRLLGEANLLPGISIHELLFGVPHADVVNAAFTHAHPEGSRFNGSDRGAWYAAFDLRTARAEVMFHKVQELREINWLETETFEFDDYQADFRAEFHDIRTDAKHADVLDPASYVQSQKLARQLLAAGSAGIVYPSARQPDGTCLVCFRPALVLNVRRGRQVKLSVHASQ